ncbi:MAG TPA: Sir2 family NAD-dependent protein deacetylase [Beijerinckiaceae bacterium]|nr:Sir2 family NAD-dependent protein deacetylase [Beijerinckiaceae bacterium]
MTAEPLTALAGWLAEARCIVGFTGAGISTESGIPDFRSPGSPWLANRPVAFDQFITSEPARREAWRRKFAMDDLYAGAGPSIGHRFLSRLVADGRSPAIITQNIDGLHQAAGTPPDKVIELHGNGTYAACLDCRRIYELAWVRARLEAEATSPRCLACDGLVKSATISFGQPMPEAAMRRAQELATTCDLFLVLGSSLVVYPAASLPLIARRAGARLVIINREPTELDRAADLVIHADIGPTLSRMGNY